MDILQYQDDHAQLSRIVDRPIREIDDYFKSLENDLMPRQTEIKLSQEFISTGIPSADEELGGGIPLGEVVEVFGASGCGKSHFLFQLLLQCQVNYPGSESIHVSTESYLETKRLQDMFQNHEGEVTMENISYIYCQDFESQDHILYTQLPIKLEQDKGKTKLVVIDSIAQHFRREDCLLNSNYLRMRIDQQELELKDLPEFKAIKFQQANQLKTVRKDIKYANRSTKLHYICLLHRHLTRLAQRYNIAIVVVNQVSDHTFDPSKMISEINENDLAYPLNLDIQTGISSGWDANTLYDYIPTHQVSLNRGQMELLDYEISKSFDNNLNKRQKMGEDIDLRAPIVDRTRELEDVKELILKSYKLRNGKTKKIVPTLGYPWTRRNSTRIMLTKTYKPVMKDKTEIDSEWSQRDSTADSTKGTNNSDASINNGKRSYVEDKNKPNDNNTPDSLISGWQVERFIKVVSTNHNARSNRFNRYQFKIDKTGLIEI
ncbi:RAD57 [[Candida] subhashii]|uniref:RAD57 n=1 Tax=[Candida] subhashii TaxID=561895 RepID=A0A8J5UYK9_9ASCO|nr:RAD57 [[Candida] subhashii]KAG7663169.1 RAD57 [[Candida] subhashii]